MKLIGESKEIKWNARIIKGRAEQKTAKCAGACERAFLNTQKESPATRERRDPPVPLRRGGTSEGGGVSLSESPTPISLQNDIIGAMSWWISPQGEKIRGKEP